MTFEWDKSKLESNLQKHGLDFFDAERVFSGPTLTFEDSRRPYGEQRFLTYGLLQERVVVIAHTETKNSIRIISMRRANRHERESYFAHVSY